MSRKPNPLRKQIRQRAGNHCEYCLRTDKYNHLDFHLDHIIPIKHGGKTELNNLAWACMHCNVSKGRDIATFDKATQTLTLLYNPRIQQWGDHFEIDGLFINGKTPIGRATVHMLEMNHHDQIEIRLRLAEAGEW